MILIDFLKCSRNDVMISSKGHIVATYHSGNSCLIKELFNEKILNSEIDHLKISEEKIVVFVK